MKDAVQDLKKAFEAGLLKNTFLDENYDGHYIQTPYHYDSDLALKYVPDSYVDFGEGLIELIKDCEENK